MICKKVGGGPPYKTLLGDCQIQIMTAQICIQNASDEGWPHKVIKLSCLGPGHRSTSSVQALFSRVEMNGKLEARWDVPQRMLRSMRARPPKFLVSDQGPRCSAWTCSRGAGASVAQPGFSSAASYAHGGWANVAGQRARVADGLAGRTITAKGWMLRKPAAVICSAITSSSGLSGQVACLPHSQIELQFGATDRSSEHVEFKDKCQR